MQLRIIVIIDQQQPKWRGPAGRERNFISTLIIEVVVGVIEIKIMVWKPLPLNISLSNISGSKSMKEFG